MVWLLLKSVIRAFPYVLAILSSYFMVRRIMSKYNNDQEPIDDEPTERHQYSDDEQPVDETPEDSPEVEVIHGEKLDMRIVRRKWRTVSKVSVELMASAGLGEDNKRLGVDIVLIVDVSSSMSSRRRQHYLKTAMVFFMRKLGPTDRLSVVKFSTSAERLCPLRLTTEDAQAGTEMLIADLCIHTDDGANLAAGLKEALEVLNHRSYFKGRKPALVILSGSEANFDDAQVPLGNVPVHAFAIGADFANDVLKLIATKSNGGTFTTLDGTTLSISYFSHTFSDCLDSLLTMLAQDLKLTVTPLKDKYCSQEEMNGVEFEPTVRFLETICYHSPTEPGATETCTISLGNLYRQDRCKVSMNLYRAAEKVVTKVLQLTYSYNVGMETYNGGPVLVSLTCSKLIDPAAEIYTQLESAPTERPQSAPPIPSRSAQLIGNAVQTFNMWKERFKSVHSSPYEDNSKFKHNIGKKTT